MMREAMMNRFQCLCTVSVAFALCGCSRIRPTAVGDVRISPDGPIKTFAAAVDRVRAMRTSGLVGSNETVVVSVAPGRYFIGRTLLLDAEDSHVRFVGPKDGEAVLDGGVELPPFVPGKDGVWETTAPSCGFDQLWVNGRRAPCARTPNGGRYLYMANEDPQLTDRAFYVQKKDAGILSELTTDELSRAVVKFWAVWDVGFGRVRSFDSGTGRMELESGALWNLFFPVGAPRYVIENIRSALDEPGEWFRDEKSGKILYIPLPGETVAETRAYVPQVESIVRLAGDRKAGRIVSGISFENLSFEHAGWALPQKGLVNVQAHINVRAAAIVGTGVEDLEITNCRIRHTGAHGVWLYDGSRDSKIVHSLLEDLGGGGAYLGETSWSEKEAERVSCGLKVEDSIVRHGGRRLDGSIGVFIGHAHDCEIVHNEICDFPYSGVSVGWTWGYRATPNRRNKVNFNRVRHIAECRLSDVGGIYTLGDNTGGEILGNWISEVNCYPHSHAPGWGIYMDEGTQGMLVASNLVENCRDIGLNIHYGMSNRVENNVFANFNRHGFSNARPEGHEVFRSERNIFFWTNEQACAMCRDMRNETAKERWSDRNLFWCSAAGAKTKVNGDFDLEEWRKTGRDLNGLVADPKFADPEKGDWTLADDSPARGLGFVPFDWRQAGVLATDGSWRRKAAERTWDEYEKVPSPESCRERIDWDFESAYAIPDPKAFKYKRSRTFETFGPSGSNGISLVRDEAFKGRQCLQLSDTPDMLPDFLPHCYFVCGAREGTMRVRFAYKAVNGGDFDFMTRDYSVGNGYVSGPGFIVRDGRVLVEGTAAGTVPRGTWIEFAFTLGLSGRNRGHCTLTAVSDGRTLLDRTWAATLPKAFSTLGWIGFTSPGRQMSTYLLDEFHVDKVSE